MKFANVEPITKVEAEVALGSKNTIRISEALLRATHYVNDYQWVGERLLHFLADTDDEVRRAACMCCGHFVRIHGCLLAELVNKLHDLRADRVVGGAAVDALDDVQIFRKDER